MKERETIQVSCFWDADLDKRIEDYQFDNRHRSRNAAVNELVQMGLKTRHKPEPEDREASFPLVRPVYFKADLFEAVEEYRARYHLQFRQVAIRSLLRLGLERAKA